MSRPRRFRRTSFRLPVVWIAIFAILCYAWMPTLTGAAGSRSTAPHCANVDDAGRDDPARHAAPAGQKRYAAAEDHARHAAHDGHARHSAHERHRPPAAHGGHAHHARQAAHERYAAHADHERHAALCDALGPHCHYCFLGGLTHPPGLTMPSAPSAVLVSPRAAFPPSFIAPRHWAASVAPRGPPVAFA